MNQYLIELQDLSKYYYSKDVVTLGLRKVNLKFRRGEFVAVIGESGCGKSTLMNVIAGIDTFEEGELLYRGEATSCYSDSEWDRYRKENISFIFQDYNLIDSYTVLENVELALYHKYPEKKKRRARALELLEKVDLSSHIKHKCTKLSGGQKQRVSIARALAKESPIIIADEPCGNLDEATSESIIKLLSEVARDKLLIIVTHNYADVKDYATRKIRLYDGSVILDSVVKQIGEPPKLVIDNSVVDIGTRERLVKHLRNLKSLSNISFNNIKSRPKSTITLLTTIMLAIILLLSYVVFVNQQLNIDYPNKRKDTMIIYKEDRSIFTEGEKESILSIKGVNDVMINDGIYNRQLYGYYQHDFFGENSRGYYFLSTSNYHIGMVEEGRLPIEKNEILLTYYSSYDKPKLGSKIIFQLGGNVDTSSISQEELEFTVVGLSKTLINTEAYLTPEGLSHLSQLELEANYERLPLLLNILSNRELITRNNFVFDESIPKDRLIHVYDKINYMGIYKRLNPLETIYTAFTRTSSELIEISFTNYFNNDIWSINIEQSNSSINSSYYNDFYNGEPIILCNPASFPYTLEDYMDANVAYLIVNPNYNSNLLISRIEKAGYRVIYPYGTPHEAYMMLEILLAYLLIFVFGLMIVGMAMILLSELSLRLFSNKIKDMNVIRSLGYRQKDLNIIYLIEGVMTHILGFILVITLIGVFYYYAQIKEIYSIYIYLYTLFPFGYLSLHTASLMGLMFVAIVSQSIWMTRRLLKKLKKSSIKKSSVEGVL